MAETDTDWSLLEHIPALPPPPGVQSDFDHPKTREEEAKIVVGLTYALMLLFLTLRIYTRIRVTNSLGVDDHLSLVAGASITAFTGLSLSLFGHPLGPHQWNVPLSDFDTSFLGRTLSSIVLFSVSSLFVKTALLSLYLRVFAPNRTARITIWAGVVTMAVFYTISVIINICFCVPLSMDTPVPDQAAWEKKLEASTCSQPVYNLNAATGLFNVLSDLYVLIIPISMVYRLRIPRNRKYGIIGIFLTGLLAVILSATSAAYRFRQLKSYDFTWDSIPSYTLRAAELNIGLICSCMPVVFVIFKRIFKSRPCSREKRTPTPHMRTPSHAYIADLPGSDQAPGTEENQLSSSTTPSTVISMKTLIRQSRQHQPETGASRSTYSELGSMESNDLGNLRDTG
ncbi:hypothetical protein F5Y12DRAFT_231815 [Xylaria sp. FL1777]|nr:hypothetical protein F5Y12DRAFT_231815 [Xylaria sp. FL1777]